MASYLLVWNPKRFSENQFRVSLKREGWPKKRGLHWACGNTKRMRSGDTVYLLRVGKDRPGIVGKGKVTGRAELQPRYDGLPGTFLYIPAEWDFLDFPNWSPTVPMAELEKQFPQQHWHPQASGISLKSEYQFSLAKLVAARRRPKQETSSQSTSGPAVPVVTPDVTKPLLQKAPISTAPDGAFDPARLADARQRVMAEVTRRRGQPAFRAQLLTAYGGRCCISGCATAEVLEAAHIVPYTGMASDVVPNGLLLRSDIHTLFDLGSLTIDSKTYQVQLCSRLRGGEYAQLHGRRLKLPKSKANWPATSALRWRQRLGTFDL